MQPTITPSLLLIHKDNLLKPATLGKISGLIEKLGLDEDAQAYLPKDETMISLVPTLWRGNAYLDAPASSFLIVTAGAVGIHSHAGAWERDNALSRQRLKFVTQKCGNEEKLAFR